MDGRATGTVGANSRLTDAAELPALSKQLNELERILHEGHAQMQRISAGVNRIRIEPTPATPSTAGQPRDQAPPQTLDARLRELTGIADFLVCELGGIAGRLDKFV